MGALIFNAIKTVKMGQQYDELNLTASDYTIFVNITATHRHEFNQKYADQIESLNQARGIIFKNYLQEKLRIQGTHIARVDLVFDNKKIINLLQNRGEALKLQKFDRIGEYERQIEAQKEYQYHADVVGAFVTYHSSKDLDKVV